MTRRRLSWQAPRWALALLLVLAVAGNVCPGTSHAETPRHHHDGAGAADDGHHDAHFAACEAHAAPLPDRPGSLVATAGPAIVLATPVLLGARRSPGPAAVIAPGLPLFLRHASLLI